MVFSRHEQSGLHSVCLLSRNYLAAIGAEEVVVPILSWKQQVHRCTMRRPTPTPRRMQAGPKTGIRDAKNLAALEAVLKHSPFDTVDAVQNELKKATWLSHAHTRWHHLSPSGRWGTTECGLSCSI